MKVYSGKSSLSQGRSVRRVSYVLLIALLALAAISRPATKAIASQQKPREVSDRLDREAKKAIRLGRYDDALKIYLSLIDADPRNNRARLGAGFAYFKMQNYAPSFQQAKEVLSVDANNARAHALAGVSLLRSGFIRAAVAELQQSLDLDSKE